MMTSSTSSIRAHVPRRRLAPSTLFAQAPGRPRPALGECLSRVAAPVAVASDAAEALRMLLDAPMSICVIDLAGGQAALTAIRLIRARHPEVLLAGIADPTMPSMAAEGLSAGLHDLLPWPSSDEEVAAMLGNLMDRAPGDLADELSRTGEIVACSATMRDLWALLERTAASDAGICLSGEPDTGRGTLARALHQAAGGSDTSFVRVECGHRPAAEIEADLFGGAGDRASAGPETISAGAALARAQGGTLLLKSVDGAPARVQSRIARVLRDGEAVIDGERVEIALRIVATLDMPIDRAIDDGRLRQDLADRFAVSAEVPPLRRRAEDVPLLATRLLIRSAEAAGTPGRRFSRAALTLLAALPWPGNLKELESVVGAVARDSRRPVVQLEDVLTKVALDGGTTRIDPGLTLRAARTLFERECITAAVLRHHGRMGEAAKSLGIQRTNLYRKVRQLKLGKALLSTRR